jgi:putative DNA primase/helicase
LAPVSMLAEKYNTAVLCVAHHRKSAGQSADELVLGSRAFTALARMVWHFFEDPHNPERRLMLPGKTNISRRTPGMAYSIVGDPPSVTWERAPVEQTADQFLRERAKPGPEPEAQNEAAEWLQNLLAEGPMETKAIEREAKNAGVSWASVRRGKDIAGAKAEKNEFTKKWQWRLLNPVGHLEQPEQLRTS